MRVVAPPDVGTLVRERGGTLYVWPDAKACCGGALTLLFTAAAPEPGRRFTRVEAEGFELWFDPGVLDPPDELHLGVRGRGTKRVEAYWNGCLYAV
ncbi:MAG: hypothetical protein ABWY83_07015 [Actinomycetota bacterium]